MLAAGELLREITLHDVKDGRALYTLDFSPLSNEARDPGLLFLEQDRTESLLLDRLRSIELCDVRFRAEFRGVRQREHGVEITFREGDADRRLYARYLVGCDGAGSSVRAALALPFDGDTYALAPVLADVRVENGREDLDWPRVWNGEKRFAFAARLPAGLWRLVSIERGPSHGSRVDDREVRDLARELLGEEDVGIEWASRFRIHIRSSPRFRVGSVLLAGDAAHIHSPALGFGMNAGIQDAHNLAWKLAAVLAGGDEERLLESYDVERRAVVVESVSRFTDLVTRFFLDAPGFVRAGAVRIIRHALRVPRFRRANLRRIAMLDLAYPASPILEADDRAAGERLPDPIVTTPGGEATRLHDLVGNAAALLLLRSVEPGDESAGGERSIVPGVGTPGDERRGDEGRGGGWSEDGESGDERRGDEWSEDEPTGDERPSDSSPANGSPRVRRIRFGSGGYRDPSGTLRKMIGGDEGAILVRPDLHVAWAIAGRTVPIARVRRALGESDS
jgi:2-polyprenyl-6-methoxyphenol hydroxylase-like FAD-dependent oxidoreductase